MAVLIDLVESLSFVFLAALTLTLILPSVAGGVWLRQGLVGVVMAAAGLCSMADPFVLQPGLLIDSRNVVVVLAAGFGGAFAALLAAVPLAVARFLSGGVGWLAGVTAMVLCLFGGLAWAALVRRRKRAIDLRDLCILGLVAGLSVLPAIILLLPTWDLVWALARDGLPAMIAVNFTGVVVAGLVLLFDRQRRDAMHRLEAFTANTPGVLYQKIIKPGGEISYKLAGPGIEKLLDVTREEIERDPSSWLRWMLPEDRAVLDEANARRARERNLEPWRFEARHLRDDGSLIWLRTDAAARRLADGSICWDGILTDVTAERTLDSRKAQIEDDRKLALEDLAVRLEVTVGKALREVGESVRGMHVAAGQMADSANQTTLRALEAAGEAESASRRVGSVAVAAEEIDASIRELTRQTTHADETARAAASYVRSTRRDVSGLVDVADKVSAVLGFIEDIAQRTNLLALNATIEAARAGAAGRGFAFVAGEVKNLAEQTQKATRDIAETLQEIRAAAATASEAVAQIEGTMTTIERTSGAIAEVVSRQAGIASGIAIDAQLVAGSANAVSASVGGVGGEARATGETAARVVDAARMVGEQTAALDSYVGEFVRGVRGRL